MGTISHAEALRHFRPIGSIALVEAIDGTTVVAIDIQADCPTRPGVYAWVAVEAGERRILYVGKAGNGIPRRQREHGRGFTRSVRGKGHAAFLRETLGTGVTIEVHGCWPDPIEVFGETVEVHSSWEDHLRCYLDPTPVRNAL